jgi:alanine racemase
VTDLEDPKEQMSVHRAISLVNPHAIERNCHRLKRELGGRSQLCAVVKANGYGHGADVAARAAVDGGAGWLAVAAPSEVVSDGVDLRAILPDTPILVMGALTTGGASPDDLENALGARCDITVWRPEFLAHVAALGARAAHRPRVHVKYDTGMGRLGARDPEVVRQMVRDAATDDRVELVGLWTHFATADEPDSDFFDEQLARFRELAVPLKEEHPSLLLHAANSAATLRDPASHFDMVRCGIAIYGLDPFHQDPAKRDLVPALELRSYVADVKRFEEGDSAGYGRTWRAPRETWVGVLPIGYGDGVRRGLSNNAAVLVGGRRYPLVGTVSMDNITIDLSPETDVEPGAPAVLIGSQGEERILAEEVAHRLDTINYEVTSGISQRVERAVPAEYVEATVDPAEEP